LRPVEAEFISASTSPDKEMGAGGTLLVGDKPRPYAAFCISFWLKRRIAHLASPLKAEERQRMPFPQLPSFGKGREGGKINNLFI